MPATQLCQHGETTEPYWLLEQSVWQGSGGSFYNSHTTGDEDISSSSSSGATTLLLDSLLNTPASSNGNNLLLPHNNLAATGSSSEEVDIISSSSEQLLQTPLLSTAAPLTSSQFSSTSKLQLDDMIPSIGGANNNSVMPGSSTTNNATTTTTSAGTMTTSHLNSSTVVTPTIGAAVGALLPMLAMAEQEPLLQSLGDAWLSGLWLWLHANAVATDFSTVVSRVPGGFLQLVFGFPVNKTLPKVNAFSAALASLPPLSLNEHYATLRLWRFAELPSEISFLVVALYRAFWRGRKALVARGGDQANNNILQQGSRIDSHYMGKSFRRLQLKLADRPLEKQYRVALDVMTHVEMLTVIGDPSSANI